MEDALCADFWTGIFCKPCTWCQDVNEVQLLVQAKVGG
jgi:hypothetical protein